MTLTCATCTTRYAVGLDRCPHCQGTERAGEGGMSMVPSVEVACATESCTAHAVTRRVFLRRVAPGVVELPRLACASCGAEMRTVTPWPREATMPKITRHGGPTNSRVEISVPGGVIEADGSVTDEQAEALLATFEERAAEGGDDLSPGSSSETSSPSTPTSNEPSETSPPKRVPTTGSRSRKGRGESGTASSTATSGPETDSP